MPRPDPRRPMVAAADSATGEATARAPLQRHQPFAPPPGEYHNFGAPADTGEEVVEAVVLRTPGECRRRRHQAGHRPSLRRRRRGAGAVAGADTHLRHPNQALPPGAVGGRGHGVRRTYLVAAQPLDEGLVQYVLEHPVALWFVGPTFAALTGLVLKEGTQLSSMCLSMVEMQNLSSS
jgi:hypothetical protein